MLGLAGLVLIALPALLPASISGVADTSAKIQINIGGFSVQPEEFGKLLLAASFASYLMEHGQQLSLLTDKWLFFKMPRRKDLAPILVVWALSMLLLIFESDIGTSAVFMGLFVAMLYIATGRRSWAVIGFGMFIAGAFLAATLVSHVGQRFSVWLHPFTTANLDRTAPSRPTRPCRACTGWPTAACSARGSAAASRSGPRWCRATSSSPRSARSSGWPG